MKQQYFLQCMSPQLARSYRHHRVELSVAIGGAADVDGLAASRVSVKMTHRVICQHLMLQ